MARRPRSLALAFTSTMLEEGPILRTEVVTALVEAGIEKAEIEGIEAPRKNQYFIVFKTFLSRRANMGKSIRVREKNVRMEHPDPSVFRSSKKRVKIYNYPLDEDISHLEKTLQHYGSFNKDSIKDLEDRACGIKNGIKEVYVDVKKNIPSYVYIGKNLVGFNYIGQEETCRKCHQTGHFGRECTTVVTCRGCGGNDHYIQTCPKVICFQCGKQGHTATSCFHYEDEFPDLNGDKESDKDEENEGNGENTNQEIDLNKVTWNGPEYHEDPNMEVEIEEKEKEKEGDENERKEEKEKVEHSEEKEEEEEKPTETKNETKENIEAKEKEKEEIEEKENEEPKKPEKEKANNPKEVRKKEKEDKPPTETAEKTEKPEKPEKPEMPMETTIEKQKEIADLPETSGSDSDGGEWTTVDGRKKKRKRGDKPNVAEMKNPSKKRTEI